MLRGPPRPLRAWVSPPRPPPPLPRKCEPARRGRPLCSGPTSASRRPRLGCRGAPRTRPGAGRGSRCAGCAAASAELCGRRSCASRARSPSPSRSPPRQVCAAAGGLGEGPGRAEGVPVSSFSLPPPPPSADAPGAPAPPPLRPRLAPGEGGWRCRGCRGAASLRPQPPSPARPEGLRGESRSARPAAPANLPAPRRGVCPARWGPRCRPRGSGGGARSSLPAAASSASAKLQSQQPAGPGGRVQPGCANFDTRASCEDAAASRRRGPGSWRRGGGVGAEGRRGEPARGPKATPRRERGETYLGTCSPDRGDAGQGSGGGRDAGRPRQGRKGPGAGRARPARVGGDWGPESLEGRVTSTGGVLGGRGCAQRKLLEEAQGMVPAHRPSWPLGGGSVLLFLPRRETFAK